MGFSRPDYSAQHVNVMASMLDRNLRTPHEVVCITDDAEGIDGGIRVVPIWDDLKQHGRCFRRLKLFASEMRDLVGERIVSLDLDTVIVGPVDDVFNRPEPFVIWSDPSRLLPYCGSQWMLTAGYRPEVFDRFNYETWRRLKPERNWHGSDQAWMAYMLPGAATWGKTDGIYSYRLDLLREGPRATWARFKRRSRIYRKPTLPENARIVHFHGVFDPSQSIIQSAVPWVAEHWR
jgi:hypothetical protein